MTLFDPASIQPFIDRTLKQAGAPDTHGKAFIVTGTTADGGGVHAIYVQKAGHGWSVMGEFEMTKAHGAAAEVGAIWTGP